MCFFALSCLDKGRFYCIRFNHHVSRNATSNMLGANNCIKLKFTGRGNVPIMSLVPRRLGIDFLLVYNLITLMKDARSVTYFDRQRLV